MVNIDRLESKKMKICDALQASRDAAFDYWRDLLQAAEREIPPEKYTWGLKIYMRRGGDRFQQLDGNGSFYGYEIRSEIGARIALKAMRMIDRITLVRWRNGKPAEYEIRRNGRRVKLEDVTTHVLGVEWI